MKTKILAMSIFCALALSIQAKDPETLRYDIECAGNGSQGTYLVKVWVYGKNPKKIDADALKKYAVHGVIFKGYAGKTNCAQQRPIAQSPALEQEKADFFKAFFDRDKAYGKYATEVSGTDERVKIGKEYKVAAIVSVSKDMLRRDLERAGVIRGLSDGF